MDAVPNLVLAALPRSVYLELLPQLAPVTLVFGDVLFELGDSIDHVYFPSACLVSLLAVVESHRALEVGMVGREGMVGLPLALGVERAPLKALVQGGGTAMQMSGPDFVGALEQHPALRRGVNVCINALMGQVATTAACNRFHAIDARLARWLLMTRDRLASGQFPLTHEFLAGMLGVRREGVTEAALAFQQRGLIEYARGKLVILDHPRLEAAACSCYRQSPTGIDCIPRWRPEGRRVHLLT